MSAGARLAAERQMARRDRMEKAGRKGGRAARRNRAPGFLMSDEDDDDEDDPERRLLAGTRRRTRRHYDERRDVDDAEGAEDVSVPRVPGGLGLTFTT
jgi:DNA replication licensing factor MCM2